MSWLSNLSSRIKTGMAHYNYLECIDQDGGRTCEQLSELVADLAPAQLDRFMRDFLGHSVAVFGSARRQRAIELYAFLKILETNRYGAYHGFIGPGGPL